MIKIFFDHFPKTAGTSLHQFFTEAFGEDAVSHPLKGMPLEAALSLYGKKIVVAGHFYLHPENGLPKGYLTATILRNPRERTLSEYFYLINNVPSAGIDPVGKLIKQSTFENVLNDPIMCQRFFNPQAIHYTALLHSTPEKLLESELLRVAKASLDLYDMVGTTELLPEFIDKMYSLSLFSNKPSLKKHNVTLNRGHYADLPHNIQARIDELTRVDRSLWEYADEIFRTKAQKMAIDDLPRNLAHEKTHALDLYSEPIRSENQAHVFHGDDSIDSARVTIKGQSGILGFFLAGELATLRVQFRAIEDIDDLTVGYKIKHESGLHFFGINSRIYGYQLQCKAGGEYHVDFVFPVMLGLGRHLIDLLMHPGHTHLDRCYFRQDKCATLEVSGFLGPFFEGIVRLMPAISFGADGEGSIEAIDVRAREEVFNRLGMNTPEVIDASGSVATLAEVGSIGRRERFVLGVEISNCGGQVWYGEGSRPVRLSYHWLHENGETVKHDGHRSPLPGGAVRPSQTVRADVMVEAPDRPGSHVLVIIMVQKSVCWFENQGFQAARMIIDILTDTSE